jgi:hypothetical protein
MQKAARALGLSTRQLEQDYYKQVRAIQAVFEAEQTAAKQEVEVRRLALEGDIAGADALSLRIQQEREVQDFVKQGYDAAALASLAYVHALETEALAKQQAIEAITKRSEGEQRGFSLSEREARVVGQTGVADRIAIEAKYTKELADIETDVIAGRIDETEAVRWVNLVTAERVKSLDDLAVAEAAQAAAEARRLRLADEDLTFRELVARGQSETAERFARETEKQRQIDEAVLAGMDDAYIQRLRYVQGLEDEAAAAAKLIEVENELRRVRELTASVTTDLKERELRATGRGGAADEFARFIREQDEVARAREGGLGAETIQEILRVQGLERGAADAQRRAAQEEAFLKGLPSLGGPEAESRTSFNAAVGITESQANRLAGLMQTQVVYQSNLPAMREALRELVQLARIGSGLVGTTLDIDAIDAALERRSGSADRAAGLPPGNV